MSLSLERHRSGMWRVLVDGAPIHLQSWFFQRGWSVGAEDLGFIYQLLDAVARPEFGVPPRRQGVEQPSGLAKELNLDVQAEQARALHRVIRAMHDGHCPSCGHLGPSHTFEKWHSVGSDPSACDHVCPKCGFTVTHQQATDGLAEFAPFLKKSVDLFNQWTYARVTQH